MRNFIKKHWLIIAILVLASFLRFWKLDSYPALNADEAAIGYNAYSLIQTGLDEHGHPWPIHFQSFNDFKPGLYFYLVLPFVKVLGLNEWAVRIPGAALGVLSVLVLYLLVGELFKNRRLSLISALFLAISPWHLQFSRGGWEVNAATFFILTGLYFFIKALAKKDFKSKILFLVMSSLFWVASLYTYHAARVVVPLLGLGTAIIYRKEVFGNIKPYLIFIAFSIILLIPLAIDLLSPGALSRVAGVGLFADQGPVNRINEQRGEHGNPNDLAAKVMHNKAVNYGLAFAENWASHYHGLFLFVSGDVIQRNAVPETGEMYLIDILFVLVGMAVILGKFGKEEKLILLWLVIAPIASALTFQSPNALRAQNMVIPLVMISAIGLNSILDRVSKMKFRKVLILLIIVLISWGFARYEHMYWVHMSKEYPFSSQYGVKQLVDYIKVNGDKYKGIVITDKYDQPYILFLFYLNYPPAQFQFHHTLTSRDEFGFSTVREFGKYSFITFSDWDDVKNDFPGDLIVATPDQVQKEANIIKKVYGENGYEYFDIIAN